MYTAITLIGFAATTYARFAQEQIPIPAISSLTAGQNGQAATIAGAAISDLLAASNSCDKLMRGDQIIALLGDSPDVVSAAIGMVAAEKNFNPFNAPTGPVCDDPTLPSNPKLRGITPLIDPGVGGAEVANALSAQTVEAPLDATGMSVADLLEANGFTNFTRQASAGTIAAIDGVAAEGAAGGAAVSGGAAAATTAVAAAPAPANNTAGINATNVASPAVQQPANPAAACSVAPPPAAAPATGGASNASSASPNDDNAGSAASNNEDDGSAAANNTGVAQQPTAEAGGAGGAADFGDCIPTMKFEGGLQGRPATEFTFLPTDPLVAGGQQSALNPNIITNKICDQLTNVCNANQAAKDTCEQAKATIMALGTRDKTTADAWNTALGFAGAVTNPDGGPESPPAQAGAAAGKKRMAVSFAA